MKPPPRQKPSPPGAMPTAFWVGMDLANTGVPIVRERSTPLRSLPCPRHFTWAWIKCRNRGPRSFSIGDVAGRSLPCPRKMPWAWHPAAL
jgi:hypothetical protein